MKLFNVWIEELFWWRTPHFICVVSDQAGTREFGDVGSMSANTLAINTGFSLFERGIYLHSIIYAIIFAIDVYLADMQGYHIVIIQCFNTLLQNEIINIV